MPILTLDAAKEQLNIIDVTDTDEDQYISSLIPVSIGIVEGDLQRCVYEYLAEVPEDALNVLVLEGMKETKKEALVMAVKLVLSTMYAFRESDIKEKLNKNPAYVACIGLFDEVVVG